MTGRDLFDMLQDCARMFRTGTEHGTSWQGGNSDQQRVWAEFARRVTTLAAAEPAANPVPAVWYHDAPHDGKIPCPTCGVDTRLFGCFCDRPAGEKTQPFLDSFGDTSERL